MAVVYVMDGNDGLADFEHDHAELNELVLSVGALLRGLQSAPDSERTATLLADLREIREHLFLHFALEEDGLFPFVTSTLSGFDERVAGLQTAHDTVCGALVRVVRLLEEDVTARSIAAAAPMFDRFELAYMLHGRAERALLRDLAAHLSPEQRERLSSIVRNL